MQVHVEVDLQNHVNISEIWVTEASFYCCLLTVWNNICSGRQV